MTKEFLMGQLYNINEDIETVENELKRMLEQLKFRREELKTSIKELEDDKVLNNLLSGTISDLNRSINALEEYLSYYKDYKDDIGESLDLCRRVAKGGIEKYES